jgi:hypothetical protein
MSMTIIYYDLEVEVEVGPGNEEPILLSRTIPWA